VTLIALLVLMLVVLAGIIAYLGDRLGTWVGRRRLSLFGARPRTTGQIVGVLSGILIMLTTIGVLAIAFQNATRTLLNVQRTLDELNRLQTQERILKQNVADADQQLADLRSQLDKAQETITTAETQRDAAVEARDAALAERESLLAQRADLAEQVKAAEARVAQADAEVEAAAQRLAGTQAELDDTTKALGSARSDRDRALQEATQARALADDAQAEAASLERGLEDARAELDDANAQLADLQNALVDVQLRLADAEQRVTTAKEELETAQTARDEALAERDTALADRDAATADRDAATAARDDALRQRADLAVRLDELSSEVKALEANAEELRRQAQELREENRTLAGSNDVLLAENARIQLQNSSLTELNDRLEGEIKQRNATVLELQGTVGDLRKEVEKQASDLADLQHEFQRFEGGEVYFVKDQLIYSGAIMAQDPAAIREELAAFINEATAFVARRGVERLRVTTEQFNVLVDVIGQTPGSDLVRFISPSNQISSTIDVLVEAIENTELFGRGQLIVSHGLHLGSPALPASQDEIRASIAQLKAEAVRKLRRAGLDDGQLPDFGPVTEEMFTNLLLRLSGPVTIGLVATEDVWRAGPAKLELMILY